MAITAPHVKISIRGTLLGQKVQVVQWYYPGGAAFLTADAVGVAQAFWNDIKAAWRACHVDSSNDLTQSVVVSEPGSSGAFGEYAIPAGEQNGTRPVGELLDFGPPFVAAGVRQTVATRVTRPGQKRFWGLMEGDFNSGVGLETAYTALLVTLMAKFSTDIILGVPVATGVLRPEIVRQDPATGVITASQYVTGFIINPRPTSQVSRKQGHGR